MITGWNNMPIRVLQEINDINSLHISDDEKTFKATALLAEMDYDKFMELPLQEASHLVASVGWVSTVPNKVRTKKEYQIGRRTYTLFKDVMGVTTAQYIDFQAVIKGGIENNLPEMLAIVLIPKGHKYGDGYDVSEVVEEIRDYFNVEEALSVVDFFVGRSNRLMRRTLRRLDAKATENRIRAKKEEKEMMKALEMEMKLANQELRSGFGYNWRKQWPK